MNQPSSNANARRVVLITTGQPSTDPRLIKEADCLFKNGFEVIVLYQYWTHWAEQTDRELAKDIRFKIQMIGGSPQAKRATYLRTRIFQRLAKGLTRIKLFSSGIAERAACRSYELLLKAAKGYRADLYIAHNLGALGIAVHAAKANKSLCGFDAEDFHRYEEGNDSRSSTSRLKIYLEEKYFLQLDYITTASALITQTYAEIFPTLKFSTILNVFPKKEAVINNRQGDRPLKMVWFSQTVGLNRGLDDVINALGVVRDSHAQLHILGDLPAPVKRDLEELAGKNHLNGQLFFYRPIPAEDIHQFLQKFDVGLALEPGFSINNSLALSNKIFNYMQAGLSVILSDTAAQQSFYEQNPDIGFCYPRKNFCELGEIIKKLDADRELLNYQKKKSLQAFNERYNWEEEQLVFLNCINKVLEN